MKKNMTAKTTIANKETVIKRSKKNKNNTKHNVSVTWTVTESSPHKCLWYIGFCAIAIWIMLFILLAKDWVLLICIFTASLALIITYLKIPAKSDCQLNYDTITINKQVLKLNDYFAYTIAATRVSKTDTQAVVLLLPKQRLRLACQVNLPDDPDKMEEVLNALNKVLPFDEAKRFLMHYRILDYITSLLRLNF